MSGLINLIKHIGNGSDKSKSLSRSQDPFCAPSPGGSNVQQENNNGGNKPLTIQSAIIVGVVAFVMCAAALYFVVIGLINANSPYLTDKQFLLETTKENRTDIKLLRENLNSMTNKITRIDVNVERILDDREKERTRK